MSPALMLFIPNEHNSQVSVAGVTPSRRCFLAADTTPNRMPSFPFCVYVCREGCFLCVWGVVVYFFVCVFFPRGIMVDEFFSEHLPLRYFLVHECVFGFAAWKNIWIFSLPFLHERAMAKDCKT